MTKKQLEQKLLAAGISKEAVDAKLAGLNEEQLKEFSDIPFATMLKEFKSPPEEEEEEEGDVLVLDPATLKEFGAVVEQILETKLAGIIEKQVAKAIEGLEIDVADLGDMEIDFKEMPQFAELKEAVDALAADVKTLLTADEARLKEMLEDTPRAGKLRIRRYKKATPPGDEDDEDDMEDEEEDDDEDVYDKKRGFRKKKSADGVVIAGANGKVAESMTEFLLGKD